jgi:hypothetical protein
MMTKKRDAGPSIAPLQLRLFRLRELASKVIATKFEPDAEGAPVLASGERKFLSVALSRIGHGVDANEVLGVKAKRGERRKPKDGTPIEGRLSPLRLRQSNLRDMAINMALPRLKPRRKGGLALSNYERVFLVLALDRIGRGAEANAALGVKARRGERRSLKEAAKAEKIRFAMSFIAAATTIKQPAMSLEEAIDSAAAFFGYDEDSLRTYWHSHLKMRSSSFERPLTSRP